MATPNGSMEEVSAGRAREDSSGPALPGCTVQAAATKPRVLPLPAGPEPDQDPTSSVAPQSQLDLSQTSHGCRRLSRSRETIADQASRLTHQRWYARAETGDDRSMIGP